MDHVCLEFGHDDARRSSAGGAGRDHPQAIVSRLTHRGQSRPAAHPDRHQCPLLADTRLVLELDLDFFIGVPLRDFVEAFGDFLKLLLPHGVEFDVPGARLKALITEAVHRVGRPRLIV